MRVLDRCQGKLNEELDIVKFIMKFRECTAVIGLNSGSDRADLQQARIPVVGPDTSEDSGDNKGSSSAGGMKNLVQ